MITIDVSGLDDDIVYLQFGDSNWLSGVNPRHTQDLANRIQDTVNRWLRDIGKPYQSNRTDSLKLSTEEKLSKATSNSEIRRIACMTGLNPGNMVKKYGKKTPCCNCPDDFCDEPTCPVHGELR